MDKKISELDQALQINNDAVFPISQDNGGTDTTYKVSITQISAEVGEDQTFSNLDTTDKTLVGAINEIAQGGGGGGSSTLAGLLDVDIDDQTLSDGQVLKYDSVDEKWINDDVGAGGHTIVSDDGTDLAQRANLQFIGAYSEDNSTDDTTEINVIRSMTRAQYDQLSAAEKTGLINITDESGSADRNYSETTLWSGSETPSTSGTQITLSDNISSYDEILFVMDTDFVGSSSFLVSELTIGESYISTIYAPNNYGVFWEYDSDTQITIKSQASSALKTYTKVVGIKYGNGTKTFHNYSTAEQVVGSWIDGSTIYERTFDFGSDINISYNSWTETSISWQTLNVNRLVGAEGFTSSGETFAGALLASKKSNGNIEIQTPRNAYDTGVRYLTIRYTKSST